MENVAPFLATPLDRRLKRMMRRMATAGVIAAAVGGPYVVSETDVGRAMSAQVRSAVVGAADPTGVQPAGPEGNAHHQTEGLWDRLVGPRALAPLAGDASHSIGGGPIADFRDVLRFDTSPESVHQRFARVTTVLSELRLAGLRAPLVTGTKPDDIAGTITYYFRHDHRLQRVCLHGFTGDPERLIDTMTTHYRMKPRRSLDAGVYTIDWNGRPTSVLKITRAPVMYADAERNQYTVFLELNQPDVEYGLSREAAAIVDADWATGRW